MCNQETLLAAGVWEGRETVRLCNQQAGGEGEGKLRSRRRRRRERKVCDGGAKRAGRGVREKVDGGWMREEAREQKVGRRSERSAVFREGTGEGQMGWSYLLVPRERS